MTIYLVIVLLVLISAAVCGQSNVQPIFLTNPPIPPVEAGYSTYISANIIHEGLTIAYFEAYHPTLNMLRVTGRNTLYNEAEIIDFNTGLLYRFNTDNPSTTCVYNNITSELRPKNWFHNGIKYLFSSEMLHFSDNSWNLTGNTNEARTQPANKYISTTNTLFSNNTRERYADLTYYTVDTTNIPLRASIFIRIVELQTNKIDRQDHYFIDFINFNANLPDINLFQIPNNCTHDRRLNLEFRRRPISYNYTAADSNTPIPKFANGFSAVVEGLVTNIDFTYTNHLAYNIDIDNNSQLQRIDMQTITNTKTTNIFSYNNKVVYTISSNDNICKVQSKSSMADLNPLSDINWNSILQKATFKGQTVSRGVIADVWQFPYNLVNQRGSAPNSMISVAFYPKSWHFPGRPDIPEQLPMRIEVNSTIDNKIYYIDEYNLFLFIEANPKPTRFDITQFNCPPYQTNTVIPFVAPARSQVHLATALFIVCLFVLLGSLGYYHYVTTTKAREINVGSGQKHVVSSV